MDAIDFLEKDHEEVLKLIAQVENSEHKASKHQQELFLKIRQDLAVHELIEEKIFYPGLKKEDRDIILEAIEEHKVVDKLLEELADTSMRSEVWKAKLTVLRENLEHHIQEEREEIFPLARDHFGKAGLEQMLSKMEALKKSQLKAETSA